MKTHDINEEILLDYVEGNLGIKEQEALELLIAQDETLQQEVRLLAKTILVPDQEIKMKDKDKLRKGTTIQLNALVTGITAIAAVLVAGILLNTRDSTPTMPATDASHGKVLSEGTTVIEKASPAPMPEKVPPSKLLIDRPISPASVPVATVDEQSSVSRVPAGPLHKVEPRIVDIPRPGSRAEVKVLAAQGVGDPSQYAIVTAPVVNTRSRIGRIVRSILEVTREKQGEDVYYVIRVNGSQFQFTGQISLN